jgi:hypothetical protein
MTWLVETAPKRTPFTPADAVDEWTIRSGNATEAGARAEARQCGPHWRKQGLRVRVRFED